MICRLCEGYVGFIQEETDPPRTTAVAAECGCYTTPWASDTWAALELHREHVDQDLYAELSEW